MDVPVQEAVARKARGAFFTPPAIADYLAAWAVGDNPNARVLDPTCGEAVFLLAAGRHLSRLGCPKDDLRNRLFGVDLHEQSLDTSSQLLREEGLDAQLFSQDFFTVSPPGSREALLPEMDAVIGNPPFVRYQLHSGDAREHSFQAALAQGVRLSGLASSWAALVVHAGAFLKPEGRLAMVFPAELLTVHYAEPIRNWLKRRFGAVHLVIFERLQFEGALEKVVLVVARGSGGCDAFSLYHVEDAEDLQSLKPFDQYAVAPSDSGKWTDLLLPTTQRQLFRKVVKDAFTPLGDFGVPELGTVTGANDYFTLSEADRKTAGLLEEHLTKISPPGTRHLKGASFTRSDWETLRDKGERVWLLQPRATSRSKALQAYVARGEAAGVHEAYKCMIREPWWIPPHVSPPDLFFTYMSHRFPRLINNSAKVSFVNSMHGIRLRRGSRRLSAPLSFLSLNTVTMLGAELFGRSYGGGILKMEPTEAASLPMPNRKDLLRAWEVLKSSQGTLDRHLRDGRWEQVVARVDEVLLRDVLGLSEREKSVLHDALTSLRKRRLG